MPYILLTQGKRTRVDTKDFEHLNRHNWFALYNYGIWYAARSMRIHESRTTMYMHREILSLRPGDGVQCDHHNHDGLDNRRSNLRICSRSENMRNQRKSRTLTSQFKGVHWNRQRQKWAAQIMENIQKHHLGYFESEITAARAYNDAAVKYHGEFACLNRI